MTGWIGILTALMAAVVSGVLALPPASHEPTHIMRVASVPAEAAVGQEADERQVQRGQKPPAPRTPPKSKTPPDGKTAPDEKGPPKGKTPPEEKGRRPSDEDEPPAEKMTICHVPPGNVNARKTITIDARAWPAHQRHCAEGTCDYQGACR